LSEINNQTVFFKRVTLPSFVVAVTLLHGTTCVKWLRQNVQAVTAAGLHRSQVAKPYALHDYDDDDDDGDGDGDDDDDEDNDDDDDDDVS
jgi:hypothetical protein